MTVVIPDIPKQATPVEKKLNSVLKTQQLSKITSLPITYAVKLQPIHYAIPPLRLIATNAIHHAIKSIAAVILWTAKLSVKRLCILQQQKFVPTAKTQQHQNAPKPIAKLQNVKTVIKLMLPGRLVLKKTIPAPTVITNLAKPELRERPNTQKKEPLAISANLKQPKI